MRGVSVSGQRWSGRTFTAAASASATPAAAAFLSRCGGGSNFTRGSVRQWLGSVFFFGFDNFAENFYFGFTLFRQIIGGCFIVFRFGMRGVRCVCRRFRGWR